MEFSHPVDLIPRGVNLYTWPRQVVGSLRTSEPVMCESLIKFYFPSLHLGPKTEREPRSASWRAHMAWPS